MGRDFSTGEDWEELRQDRGGAHAGPGAHAPEGQPEDAGYGGYNGDDGEPGEGGLFDEAGIRDRNSARAAARRKRRKKEARMRALVIACLLALAVIAAVLVVLTLRSSSDSAGAGGSASGRSDQAQLSADGSGTADDAKVGGGSDASADADDGSGAADDGSGDAAGSDAGTGDADGSDAGSDDSDDASAASDENETSAAAVSHSDGESDVLSEAALLAAGYDYDGAIELLQSADAAGTDTEIQAAITDYQAQKDACVAVDVTTVSHIFYHSLINDTGRAFDVSTLGQFAVDGMNAWMTTIEEFDKVTERLYEAGYVYVRLRDLVTETVDADGTVHFEPNDHLMLPEGKKAIVLSVDDLSYYHSYEKAGFPEKLVLDDDGLVKCLYTDADGNTSIGDYDVVPRLNTFLTEHPDGAYKGARGLIALTGYNGVFGYRTDIDYKVQEHLMDDQRAWLDAHPDFNYDQEIADATVIADAIKDEGWEFASHTWGHLSVTGKTAGELATDNEKWVNTVQPIVGDVDTIIFAHGADIGDWMGYSSDNEQYAYYNSVGYHFYCNVDASQKYWVQITDDYVRQGRINVDGYRLYQASIGEYTSLGELIDLTDVFDTRRPTPVTANGQA